MTHALTKFKTLLSLGPLNLIKAVGYRLGVKTGLSPVRRLKGRSPVGIFFSTNFDSSLNLKTTDSWVNGASLFGYWSVPVTDVPPDWHANVFNGRRIAKPFRNWWQIRDFDPQFGDIKLIWELSRFDWVLAFAQRARIGDQQSIERLNYWLNDWCQQNPPYKGPNWKCGQEASIRVMHIAMAALILKQIKTPSVVLMDLLELHLQRIAPTLNYAIAQDNNHGTSEAAALFIGGNWLCNQGRPRGESWAAIGRKWLENRAERLISEDGSFSQYSLNYHRVLLDTFCIVEIWRRQTDLQPFSLHWQKRAVAASHWLHAMVNRWNGDGPNLGANDGARLLQLTDTGYRDYRPSVQLASVLFSGAKAYSSPGYFNESLRWLGIELPSNTLPELRSEVFDQGGFAILRENDVKLILRYPRFSFRPSHADALHVDLWLRDHNLLRDAGTFSYNTKARWLSYFPGTESHNTVQFDGRDQMPRISRFLFGDWLKPSVATKISQSAYEQAITAGYKDGQGAQHIRTVQLRSDVVSITDQLAGFERKAVLRWRLAPGDWEIKEGVLSNGIHSIRVEANVPVRRYELLQGWESRYYHHKKAVPVLEVEVCQSGTLTTEYRWNS